MFPFQASNKQTKKKRLLISMKHIKLRIHTFKPVVGFSFFSDAALCNAMLFRSDGYDVWRCYNFFLLKNKKSLLLLIPSDIHLGAFVHFGHSVMFYCFISILASVWWTWTVCFFPACSWNWNSTDNWPNLVWMRRHN